MGVKLLSDELIGGVRYLWKSVIRWEESCTTLCCLFPNLILYYKVSYKVDIRTMCFVDRGVEYVLTNGLTMSELPVVKLFSSAVASIAKMTSTSRACTRRGWIGISSPSSPPSTRVRNSWSESKNVFGLTPKNGFG